MITGNQRLHLNHKYFVSPVVLGVLPAVLGGIVFLTCSVFGKYIPEAIATAAAVYFLFMMIYSYPPALAAYPFHIEVLHSQSGSPISYPNTIVAWLVVILFYSAVGVFINMVLGVKFRTARSNQSGPR